MARQIGEDVVILNLATGIYFGLDMVGARMWALLSEGKTVAEACDAVLEEYDVERERLEGDMADLLSELVSQGLVKLG